MRFLILCWFISFSPNLLKAQIFFYNDKYFEDVVLFEVAGGIGAMNCLTDLGGNRGNGRNFIKDLDMTAFNMSFHVAMLATYKDKITARLQITSGKIHASDHRLKQYPDNNGGRYQRNLSFKSDIKECALLFDIYPLAMHHGTIAPFLSTGVSLYHFSPMANLDGRWYHLQPLRTEGQGIGGSVPYDLTQFALPIGAGVRFDVSALFRMRLQVMHRKLFTDYLDDVSKTYVDPRFFFDALPTSMAFIANRLHDRRGELDPAARPAIGQQRGNPDNNDSWFTVEIWFSYCLRSKR